MGIINAQTVISCGFSINIYSSFNLTEIRNCPQVSIQEKTIQLFEMNIYIEDNKEINIYLSSKIITTPKLMIKLNNNSFIHSSNFTQINTFYLLFSSELICRFSFLKNLTICFYYPLLANFIQIEHQFDMITNSNLQTHQHFIIIIYIIITILITILCLIGLYILCTNQLPYHSMIQLDYIIDPQLAKNAALNLGPEPI